MLYFSPPSKSDTMHRAMLNGEIGFIQTPEQGNKLPADVVWCMDNGCFSPTRAKKGIPWDEQKWWKCVLKHSPHADRCVFATAPDVLYWINDGPVGDAEATLVKARPWFPRIRELGYPAALVAQDGLVVDDVPWDEFDVLFIGGSDDYKIGAKRLRMDGTPKGYVPCEEVVAEARRRDVWVHLGRVNSRMRYRFAKHYLKVQSVDGTYVTYGPDQNIPDLLSWVREPELDKQLSLF